MLILKQLVLLFANYSDVDVTNAIGKKWAMVRSAIFVVWKRSLLPKVPIFETKKWHFEWPNQNSKTTSIVQTFPKYGPYDFYFVNLSQGRE